MKASSKTGFHTFLDGDGPHTCALCHLTFATIELAASAQCEEAIAKARDECETVLYAVKEVLGTKHEKVTPLSGPNAGKRIKQRVDATEKLVRIHAAIYSLLSTELRTALEDEAKNRVVIGHVSGRKPWGS